MAARKRPKIVERVEPAKIAKWQSDPQINGEGPLSWRFSTCDGDGPFRWDAITPDDLVEVLSRLAMFEGMSWQEIIDAGSHPIETHRLEQPARSRLGEIQHDDLDNLMSLRISGAKRVWCIQHGCIMRVLWWDPGHQVYLVERDRADRQKRRNRRRISN